MRARAMFRFLAVLVCTALTATGCVDDGVAPPPTEATHHEGALAAYVAALQGEVGAYDDSLGTLVWDDATLEHASEGGFDVVVVPISGSRQRVLAARVDAGGRALAFSLAIVDYAIDPETDLPFVLALRDVDGTARPAPGGETFGCFSDCISTVMSYATAACPFTPNPPACLAAAAAAGTISCTVHCFWSSIWPF